MRTLIPLIFTPVDLLMVLKVAVAVKGGLRENEC